MQKNSRGLKVQSEQIKVNQTLARGGEDEDEHDDENDRAGRQRSAATRELPPGTISRGGLQKVTCKNSLLPGRGVVFNQGVMSQTHPLTTTTFELPGYRVTKSFGVVRGIMVRSRSVIGNIGANIQSIFGGNITLYTNLCERAREDTFNLMLTHAGQLGANAVIGVRYDATEIAPGITEVLCYGTAVFVEKEA
jgi:uncharacterized protein YbjQ (UPF0145 family)